MNKEYTVVSAHLDKSAFTMYCADGEVLTVKQGEPFLGSLCTKVMAGLAKDPSNPSVVITSADMLGDVKPLNYQEIATQLGVKLLTLFNSVITEVVGTIKALDNQPVITDPEMVKELVQKGNPTTEPTGEGESMVAIVGDKALVGAEALDPYLLGIANGLGSPEGVKKFLERLVGIERGHSVADLLKFLKEAELPITDDGAIVFYKRLHTLENGSFVDVHTKSVRQGAGYIVEMDESLVDPNRHADCSQGLHVASRSYLRNFNGDAIFIGKTFPECVIAVPRYNTNKMRVSRYELVFKLDQANAKAVDRNKPLVDSEPLRKVLCGDFPSAHTKIRVGVAGGVLGTETLEPVQKPAVVKSPKAASLDKVMKPLEGKPVDVTKVAKVVKAVSGNTTEALRLFNAFVKKPSKKTATELYAFKRKSKKGWSALKVDMTDELLSKLESLL